jgi:hypothetical protein
LTPQLGTRVIMGTTYIDMQTSAEIIFATNTTEGYISDLDDMAYLNMGQAFQDLRNTSGIQSSLGRM